MATSSNRRYGMRENGIKTPMAKGFVGFELVDHVRRRVLGVTQKSFHGINGNFNYSLDKQSLRERQGAYWVSEFEVSVWRWAKFLNNAPWNIYEPEPSLGDEYLLPAENMYIFGHRNAGKTFVVSKAHEIADLNKEAVLYTTPKPDVQLFSDFDPDKHRMIILDDVTEDTFKEGDAELLRNILSGYEFTITREGGRKDTYKYWNGFFTMVGRDRFDELFTSDIAEEMEGLIYPCQAAVPNIPAYFYEDEIIRVEIDEEGRIPIQLVVKEEGIGGAERRGPDTFAIVASDHIDSNKAKVVRFYIDDKYFIGKCDIKEGTEHIILGPSFLRKYNYRIKNILGDDVLVLRAEENIEAELLVLREPKAVRCF